MYTDVFNKSLLFFPDHSCVSYHLAYPKKIFFSNLNQHYSLYKKSATFMNSAHISNAI